MRTQPRAAAITRRATPLTEERALAERALDTLRTLGVQAKIDTQTVRAEPFDYMVTLGRGGKRAPYCAEVKRTLRPATIGPVLLRLQKLKNRALLLADYITPQMAKTLREQGIPFADTAGNAYVEMAGDLIFVVGNVPEQRPRAEKVVRAFQPTGLRVVFALLCDPELVRLSTRDLATRVAVANGTVGRVLDDLAHLGFLTTAGRRDRQLHNLHALVERWVMMYPAQLRPTLLRRQLTAEGQDWWKKEKFDGDHVALGGQPAGDILTDYLKPATVTLYVRGEPRPLNELVVRNHLRTDPEGEIEVLEAFWPVDLIADKRGLVPTLLVYADLLATGDARCIETAKRIYDDYLAKRFGKA
jgi:hypothetical protein